MWFLHKKKYQGSGKGKVIYYSNIKSISGKCGVEQYIWMSELDCFVRETEFDWPLTASFTSWINLQAKFCHSQYREFFKPSGGSHRRDRSLTDLTVYRKKHWYLKVRRYANSLPWDELEAVKLFYQRVRYQVIRSRCTWLNIYLNGL